MLYKLYEFIKNREDLDLSHLQNKYIRTLLLKEHMLMELWNRDGFPEVTDIIQAKDEIGVGHFRRFLTIPVVSSKLLHAEMNPRLYSQLLKAEVAKLTGQPCSGGEEIWTAVGDRCLGGIDEPPSIINEHVSLDFFSPWLDECDQPGTSGYDYAEASDISQKISEAMLLIKQVDESLYRFTQASTEVIQIRKTAKIYSYSCERRLGRVFFGQPIVHYKTRVGLACGIYHEAIHNHIYLIEKFQHMFTNAEGMNHFVVSPWSGNYIELHSFCHAIFVWYALWAFCKQCSDHLPEFADQARESGIEAGFGFLRGVSILSTMQPQQKSQLDPRFMKAVEEMQEDVQGDERKRFASDGSCLLRRYLQQG